MATEWIVEVPAEPPVLDAQSRGEIVFTVTNVGTTTSRAVLDVVPVEGTDRSWFTVPEPRRPVAPGASETYHVTLAVPPGTRPGTYFTQARVYSDDSGIAPEESSRPSKRVQFEIPEPKAPRRPWWPYAVAAGLVVLVLLTVVWLVVGKGGEGPSADDRSPAPSSPVAAPPSAQPPSAQPPSAQPPSAAPPSAGPVRVPDVRGDTTATATARLRAAGFTVRIESVDDPTCESIDRVIRQTPAAETTLLPGQTVTIVVGEKPSTPCK
jgi:PASTA domain